MLAYLGVGSNLGDRKKNIELAQSELKKVAGINFIRSARLYETHPVGGPPDQENYFNTAWEIETTLSAEMLLETLLKIEKTLGRIRTERNAPRVIDLDLLFYGPQMMKDSKMTVPHARLHERLFVLIPMAELAPDFIHPEKKKTLKTLLEEALENCSGVTGVSPTA